MLIRWLGYYGGGGGAGTGGGGGSSLIASLAASSCTESAFSAQDYAYVTITPDTVYCVEHQFSYVGDDYQYLSVPSDVSTVLIEATGPSGGSTPMGMGGLGGYLKVNFSSLGGQRLTVSVGGGTRGDTTGGASGTTASCPDVVYGGGFTTVSTTLVGILAAGGGGAAGYDPRCTWCNASSINGGAGGGGQGGQGDGSPAMAGSYGGLGGETMTGRTAKAGAGGYYNATTNMGSAGAMIGIPQAGNGAVNTCGGGGGGGSFSGGGGSYTGGGGGGANYANPDYVLDVVADINGFNNGSGYVTISYCSVFLSYSPTASPTVFLPSPAPTSTPTTSIDSDSLNNLAFYFSCGFFGVLLCAMMFVFFIRKTSSSPGRLNSLRSGYTESVDMFLKCGLISLSLYELYAFQHQKEIFILLILSRGIILSGWIYLNYLLFAPVCSSQKIAKEDLSEDHRDDDDDDDDDGATTAPSSSSSQLIRFLDVGSLRGSRNIAGYSILLILCLMDPTLFRLLPWKETEITRRLEGYPTVSLFRSCLYVTLLAQFLQTAATLTACLDNDHSSVWDITKDTITFVFVLLNAIRNLVALLFHELAVKIDHARLKLTSDQSDRPLLDPPGEEDIVLSSLSKQDIRAAMTAHSLGEEGGDKEV